MKITKDIKGNTATKSITHTMMNTERKAARKVEAKKVIHRKKVDINSQQRFDTPRDGTFWISRHFYTKLIAVCFILMNHLI